MVRTSPPPSPMRESVQTFFLLLWWGAFNSFFPSSHGANLRLPSFRNQAPAMDTSTSSFSGGGEAEIAHAYKHPDYLSENNYISYLYLA